MDVCRHFVVVTNIPSPYRLHEFKVLNEALANRGIGFEAVFLAATEHGRYWTFDAKQCDFPLRLAPGWSFSVKGKPFLFNPDVVWAQLRQPPTWLWLGGSWYLPTVVALAWKMRWRGRSWILGWNESTQYDKHTLSSEAGLRIRRFLLQPYHGWIVPGSRSAKYAREGLDGAGRPILTFPNTVDAALYRDRVAELRRRRNALREKWGVPQKNVRVFLWPARLSPEKGILPFLKAIDTLRDGYTILIAGEGPQRPEIEAWLSNRDLPVRLLGHQDAEQLLELYALANVLLLPSLSEPFGFVAVEALWAGLPLLLSERVGALPEVLQPGRNGWVIDPEQPEQIRQVFWTVLACGNETLAQMGRVSLALAEERFASQPAVRRFVDDLLAAFPPRQ